MKKKFKFTFLFFILFFCLTEISCSPSSDFLEKYGDDGYYFIGLEEKKKGNSNQAEKFFNLATEKASPFFAKLSWQELLNFGNRSKQLQTAIKFHKKFSDAPSLLVITRKLYHDGELSQLIKLTDKIDYASSDNELCYYRISALYQKNNSKFRNAYYRWCTLRKFTSWHYKLYCEVLDMNDVITMRANIYTRDYGPAFSDSLYILENKANYLPQIISDAGKAFLYGSSAYSKNAAYFDHLASSLDGENKFYACFYAARLYSRVEETKSYAAKKFEEAMKYAQSDSDYDTALWYFLDLSLSSSISEAYAGLEKYAGTFKDPEYFDDFFDTLSVRIFSNHMWDEFYKITNSMQGYASKEASCRFAYLSARLIQEGFYLPQEKNKDEEIDRLLKLALDCGSAYYYRFLAAEKLNMEDEEVLSYILNISLKNDFSINEDAEKLLNGLMDLNLEEELYPNFQKYGDEVGLDCTRRLSLYLKKDAGDKNNFYSKSMRIALKRNAGSDMAYDEDFLKLMYPDAFKTYIDSSCKKYKVSNYLIFALTRSESYFETEVSSSAGAKGLTQIMQSTADDIAKKLHYAEYDLGDPKTNIEFGTYYFSTLLNRFDSSVILSLFGYNAGPGRINSWLENTQTEFGRSKIANDIFLESIPYSETRDYGRKVLTAACMYAKLYQGQSFSETVKFILGQKENK